MVADLASSDIGYEINLLDNDSGEDLSDLAGALPPAAPSPLRATSASAAATTCWRARRAAPYLLILNPDVELIEPDTVARLLAG